MRNGAAGLSFGYLTVSDRKAAGGVIELTAIDLFEVTITPRPMNADTAILSMKAIPPLKVASFEC
jgi:phage head maturation protease